MTKAKLDRLLLSLLLLGTLVWLGGSLMRAMLINDLFVPGTLEFHGNYSADAELQQFRLIALSGTSIVIAYLVTILSGLVYFVRQRCEWRRRPWFFMAGALVLLYLPFEIAQGLYDLELISSWFPLTQTAAAPPGLEQCRTLLMQRLQFWNGFGGMGSVLAALAYLTALFLVVWRPLDKARSDKREVTSKKWQVTSDK